MPKAYPMNSMTIDPKNPRNGIMKTIAGEYLKINSAKLLSFSLN